MGKNMGEGSYYLLMGLNTKEIFFKTIYIIKEFIYGQMEDFIKDNGKKIKCTEKGKFNGQTENHMKEIFKMIKDMVKGYFNGQKESAI